MRVLLVENDPSIVGSMKVLLKLELMNVSVTGLGEEAVDLVKLYDYNIILLDLNLPDISGYEVLSEIRAARVNTPVMILSGIADVADKVKALNLGADDYLVKPFHTDELIARIHALVRRSKGYGQQALVVGEVTLDLSKHVAIVKNREVVLTKKEYLVLELLMLQAGKRVSNERIIYHLYGERDEPESNVSTVLTSRVRRKLQNEGVDGYITAIRGVGYIFQVPA